MPRAKEREAQGNEKVRVYLLKNAQKKTLYMWVVYNINTNLTNIHTLV